MTAPRACQLLRIHLGEDDRFQGVRAYEEILRRCRQAGAELVAVYRGIEGFGASTLVHRPGLLGRSKDAPIVVTAVVPAPALASLLTSLSEVVTGGMMAISPAEVIHC